MKSETPAARLKRFIGKFNPAIGAAARSALTQLRALLPPAREMVYDNYNALVIGFAATDRPSEAILSIAVFPRWVTLCFLQGAKLADPDKLLQGSGNQVRHLRLENARTLDAPAVRKLIARALAATPKPFDRSAPRQLIIKSISAQQRPRR